MKPIFNRHFLVICTLFFSLLFLTSCDKLKILVYTKINADGSANRKVEYVLTPSDSEELKYIYNKLPDLLAKGFVMPAEPEWKVDKFVENGAFHYVAEKKFNTINDLKFDYYKISQYVGASRNYISYDSEDKSSSDTFSFMEIYRDSSNIVKFSQCFASYLENNKSALTRKLYDAVHPVVSKFSAKDADKVVSLFMDKSKNFESVLKSFDIIGPRETKIIENELTKYNNEIQLGKLLDYLTIEDKEIQPEGQLAKMFDLDNVKLSQDKRKELFDRLKNVVNEEFKTIAVANNIDPLGAYLTNLDMLNSYSFEYTIEMPGSIVKSNGNRIDENKVQWIFEPEDFFNNDYVISVKSVLEK
ncbi:MAG: hypothetical protein AB7V50_02235 [Vampirovibrionia bacterium]